MITVCSLAHYLVVRDQAAITSSLKPSGINKLYKVPDTGQMEVLCFSHKPTQISTV